MIEPVYDVPIPKPLYKNERKSIYEPYVRIWHQFLCGPHKTMKIDVDDKRTRKQVLELLKRRIKSKGLTNTDVVTRGDSLYFFKWTNGERRPDK